MQEGVLETARDGNIGSLLGIGFPKWTGGVFQFINLVGTHQFADRALELEARYGERYAPPQLLLDKARSNERFD
jgi:3-hydroxyacyl-CoA dehydrogenase/enoyl-CoA hydratase/3-hydroxybutyryl-CoA epimerase